MITDIFQARYDRSSLVFFEFQTDGLQPFFIQCAHILEDLAPALGLDEAFFRNVHDRLAREFGVGRLIDGLPNYTYACGGYLVRPRGLTNEPYDEADVFLKRKFSLLELLFRAAEETVAAREAAFVPPDRPRGLFRLTAPKAMTPSLESQRRALNAALTELNQRLRNQRTGLAYHNGFLHLADDALSTARTTAPFWEIVAAPRWRVVDEEMKAAVEHLDRTDQDAVVHALCALESAIKILSDDHGWSTGKERGAANFIDNLAGERSSAFIARWEADALRALYRDIRNPRSHGGGSAPPAPLSAAQLKWVVETAMGWIKSLVTREDRKPALTGYGSAM
ncbi:hypothetical protein [Caulobacter sp. RHG1]|uniref:hypothetical protein n=1 Tax=Caulobacter sp. (strain RHG1) TaxID=2545762 RepID=UPI0015559484|nr:hypothetical protein [Caulobacter sp. RHG1]NQE65345.1 hypothetical protein [Caulobacter sp. RHG1]